jgi:hypothetical protein
MDIIIETMREKNKKERKKTHQNDSDLRMKCGLTTTLLTFKSSLMMTAKKKMALLRL